MRLVRVADGRRPTLCVCVCVCVWNIVDWQYCVISDVQQNDCFMCVCVCMDFPGGTSGKESAYQFRRHKRHRFDPWVGKIPWWREWQPTSVFLPGESPWTEEPGGLQSVHRIVKSQTWLKRLSTHACVCVYMCVCVCVCVCIISGSFPL